MGSSMFDAGYQAGYRDAIAEVRRSLARPRRQPKPKRVTACVHGIAEGYIWHCNVCGESGGNIPETTKGDLTREEVDAFEAALAAGSGTAETNEDLAQCEASQSGPTGNAQGPAR